MSTFDLDYDYLQLLGIDPADALRAPTSLAEKIKVKKKEWTAQALNPLYQQAARSHLERSREFEELLGADLRIDAATVAVPTVHHHAVASAVLEHPKRRTTNGGRRDRRTPRARRRASRGRARWPAA